MLNKNENVTIKFDFSSEQTVGQITKVTGLIKAKYLIPIIDTLDLKANCFLLRQKEFYLPLPDTNGLNAIELK